MIAIIPAIPIGIGIWEAVTWVAVTAVTWGGVSYAINTTTEGIEENIIDPLVSSDDDVQEGFDDVVKKAGAWLLYGLVGAFVFVVYKALRKRVR